MIGEQLDLKATHSDLQDGVLAPNDQIWSGGQ